MIVVLLLFLLCFLHGSIGEAASPSWRHLLLLLPLFLAPPP